MTEADDLRARITAALTRELISDAGGRFNASGLYAAAARYADAVIAALGVPDMQWATRCGTTLYPAPEERARYRAHGARPAHELVCRRIAILEDWRPA